MLDRPILPMIACLGALAAAPAAAQIPDGFQSRMIETPTGAIHAVMEEDDQAALVLLHGWPQDWSEWRAVMPALALEHRVIALDLPGIGGSAPSQAGYEKTALADQILAVLDTLEIDQAHIVGHDIGGMIAFALAAEHGDRALSVTIADVPVPGLPAFELVSADPRTWHFGFHATPHLPEAIVHGDQAAYFRHFFEVLSVESGWLTDTALDGFVAAYQSPEQLAAGFEFYRAFAADAEFNATASLSGAPPILILGGEASMAGLLPMQAEAFAARGAAGVETAAIPGAGHWIAEENPDAVVQRLRAFLDNERAAQGSDAP